MALGAPRGAVASRCGGLAARSPRGAVASRCGRLAAPPPRPANPTELYCEQRHLRSRPPFVSIQGVEDKAATTHRRALPPKPPPTPPTRAIYKDTLIFSPLLLPLFLQCRHPLLLSSGVFSPSAGTQRRFNANKCLQLFLRGEEGARTGEGGGAGGREKVRFVDQAEHWLTCDGRDTNVNTRTNMMANTTQRWRRRRRRRRDGHKKSKKEMTT